MIKISLACFHYGAPNISDITLKVCTHRFLGFRCHSPNNIFILIEFCYVRCSTFWVYIMRLLLECKTLATNSAASLIIWKLWRQICIQQSLKICSESSEMQINYAELFSVGTECLPFINIIALVCCLFLTSTGLINADVSACLLNTLTATKKWNLLRAKTAPCKTIIGRNKLTIFCRFHISLMKPFTSAKNFN